MSITFLTVPPKTLYQPILSTDVTFKLSDIVGFDGVALTSASFGTEGYGVILNFSRTIMELFSWNPTTIASSSISFVARGLPFTGSGASVTANKLDWAAGSTVLIGSDTPQFIQWLKDYIDGIAISGSPNASTTAKGIVEEATQAEVDAGTAAGSTAARLFINPSTHRGRAYNDYAVDSVGTDAYAITITPAITAYAAGQVFTFKAGTANTGACTLNVSGLGAKDIRKDASTALATGDILANQVVTVVYDGTNMQLISVISGATTTTAVNAQVLPLVTGKQYTVGALDNALVKTYLNIQLPFILWTGSTSGALTTDFTNWLRSSTDIGVSPMGSMMDVTGIGGDDIYINFLNSAYSFDSTKIIVLDFFAQLPASGTGDIQMGFDSLQAGGYQDIYTVTTHNRIMFNLSAAGALYATTSKRSVGVTNTDISSGLTLTNWNHYRIEAQLGSGGNAAFYVNGVLKATLSGANFPVEAGGVGIIYLGFGRSNTSLFKITAPNISLQLI